MDAIRVVASLRCLAIHSPATRMQRDRDTISPSHAYASIWMTILGGADDLVAAAIGHQERRVVQRTRRLPRERLMCSSGSRRERLCARCRGYGPCHCQPSPGPSDSVTGACNYVRLVSTTTRR